MRKRYCGPTIYERVIRPRWLWTTMVMKSPPQGPHYYIGNKTSLGFQLPISPSAFVRSPFMYFDPKLYLYLYLHCDPAKTSIPRRHDQLTVMSADSEGESQRPLSPPTTTPDDVLCWFLITFNYRHNFDAIPFRTPLPKGVYNWKQCLLTQKEKVRDFYFSTTTTPDGAFCWFLITIALT